MICFTKGKSEPEFTLGMKTFVPRMVSCVKIAVYLVVEVVLKTFFWLCHTA